GATVAIGDGSLTVNADGSLTFDPPTDYTGLLRFEYRLANDEGTSDATVTLAVGVRPDAVDDAYDVLGNVRIASGVAAGLFANDAGDEITLTGSAEVGGPTGGSLGIAGSSGSMTYTPA